MDCTIQKVATAIVQTPALSWEEARQTVLNSVRRLGIAPGTQSVPLGEAYGRVLAADLAADRDYPTLRRSLRDGFAVRSTDLPGSLKIRGEVRAGDPQTEPLKQGEALEIMTGAPVPEGADAIIMVEHAERLGDTVKIDQDVAPGTWINQPGSESHKDVVLLTAGTPLNAGHIATLAMTGHSNVTVFAQPSVAILATGDEIVSIDTVPGPHQIRNSNSYMLAAMVRACGGVPHILPVATDTEHSLRAAFKEGLRHNMLLVSGGVSAGRYDLVKPVLRELGVVFEFERVRIQPGGPCAFGTLGDTAVFGLPGNPGSSYVTFQLFAQAALSVLLGDSEPVLPLLTTRFSEPFRHRRGLTRFLPARLSADGQHLAHIPWQGSSDVPALAKANAFLVADESHESWAAGDTIRVLRKL